MVFWYCFFMWGWIRAINYFSLWGYIYLFRCGDDPVLMWVWFVVIAICKSLSKHGWLKSKNKQTTLQFSLDIWFPCVQMFRFSTKYLDFRAYIQISAVCLQISDNSCTRANKLLAYNYSVLENIGQSVLLVIVPFEMNTFF